MLYLDYSIHQYPRYLHRWKQTNWFDDFRQAALHLYNFKNIKPEDFHDLFYNAPVNPNNKTFIGQIYYWLCWRAASRMPIYNNSIDLSYQQELGWTTFKKQQIILAQSRLLQYFPLPVDFKRKI